MIIRILRTIWHQNLNMIFSYWYTTKGYAKIIMYVAGYCRDTDSKTSIKQSILWVFLIMTFDDRIILRKKLILLSQIWICRVNDIPPSNIYKKAMGIDLFRDISARISNLITASTWFCVRHLCLFNVVSKFA